MAGIHHSEEMEVIQLELYFVLERKSLFNRVLGNCSALFILPFLPIFWLFSDNLTGMQYLIGGILQALIMFAVYYVGGLDAVIPLAVSILFIQTVAFGLSIRDQLLDFGCIEYCEFDEFFEMLAKQLYEKKFNDIPRIDLDIETVNQKLLNQKSGVIEFRKLAKYVAENHFPDSYFYGFLGYWGEHQTELTGGAIVAFSKKPPFNIIDTQELHLPELSNE